ncbi:MAG: hypothetical protein V7629_10015 [Motiliproteus sp.]
MIRFFASHPSAANLFTSELFPAVTGMQLAPTLDVAAQAALNAWLEAQMVGGVQR